MNILSSFSLQILFIFNIINKVINKSPLILSFITEIPSKLNPDNYFEIIFKNEPKIDIKAGTHRQSIPCYININTPTTYITGSNSSLAKNQIKYQESKSTKYQNLSDTITSESFYVYGMPSIDEICLNNDEVIQLKFYLAHSKFSSNELSYSCILGLGYDEIIFDNEDEEEKYLNGIESFISQMKKNNIITKKIFFINYNDNDDNGQVVFGTYPHEIKENNNKYCESCNEEDYIEIENIINEIEVIWSVKGYAYMGEKMIFDYLCSIEFEITQGFIIGSYNYKTQIEESFFNEKIAKNECFKNEIFMQNKAFDGYYCKKNIDISKIENLTLIIDKIKYKIEFTSDDLFSENEGYLYFNVLFTQNEDIFNNDFILGKPFFKKYPIVFNSNGRGEKIGFYHNLFFKKKERINKNNNEKNSKLTILLIIIGMIIVALLMYISIKYFRRPRKQKVNELIEFFDYSSAQKSI